MQTSYVIYVPGLGDSFDAARQRALSYWKLWGITAKLVPMNWRSGETYDAKYQRLLNEVNQHEQVIIIGESAGATMALRAFNDNMDVIKCITICGVAKNTVHISALYSTRAPALRTATENVPNNYNNAKNILSIFSPFDTTVVARNAVAVGATKRKIYVPTHMLAILFGLVLYLPYILKFKFRVGR